MSSDSQRKTLTVEGRRTPFSGSWRLSIKCAAPLPAAPGLVLERFISTLSRRFPYPELLTDPSALPQLRDLRGMPLERESIERLLRCAGSIAIPREDPQETNENAERDEDRTEPFSFEIGTRFERFDGASIVYRVERAASAALSSISRRLTPMFLSRMVPARIDSASLGFDIFAPRTFGALFGSAPMVAQEVRFELSRAGLDLSIAGTFPPRELIEALDVCGVISAYDAALGTNEFLPRVRARFSENLAKRIAFSEALS